MNKIKNIEFSKSTLEKVFIKYVSLLGGSFFILIAIYQQVMVGCEPFSSLLFGGSGIVIVCISIFFPKILAFGISICEEDKLLNFTMFDNKEVCIKFEELDSIIVHFYITFKSNSQSIKYNDVTNKELIKLLEQIKPLQWTKMGRFINRFL